MKIFYFVSYAMLFTEKTKTLKRIRIPNIVLKESNEDGWHFFMYLYTGKEIHSNDWVESPVDDEVVKRVEELAKLERQTTFDQYPIFEWAPGIPILDDMTGNEDEEYDEENSKKNILE